MTKSKELRTSARQHLKGNWGTSIGVYITYLAIIIGLNLFINYFIHSFFVNLITLLTIPLQFGFINYFLLQSKREAKYSTLFQNYTNKVFWKSIVVQILFGIGAFLVAIPFIIIMLFLAVSMISDMFSKFAAYINNVIVGPLGTTSTILIILAFVAIIPIILYSYVYSQVAFITVENPNYGIIQIFKESRILMKKNKWRLFKLQFTFILWNTLVAITFGLASFYVVPYFAQALAEFYQSLKISDRYVIELEMDKYID